MRTGTWDENAVIVLTLEQGFLLAPFTNPSRRLNVRIISAEADEDDELVKARVKLLSCLDRLRCRIASKR